MYNNIVGSDEMKMICIQLKFNDGWICSHMISCCVAENYDLLNRFCMILCIMSTGNQKGVPIQVQSVYIYIYIYIYIYAYSTFVNVY